MLYFLQQDSTLLEMPAGKKLTSLLQIFAHSTSNLIKLNSIYRDYVVLEFIHTSYSPHRRSLEIPRGKGGLESQTFRRKV